MGGIKHFVAALLLAWPSAAVLAQAAAPPRGSSPPRVSDVIVNMRDVEIAQVAEQVSRITGRTLILDPSVKGVVNVVSAEPLSADGVWDLFRSVLRGYGFAAVRSGAAWRIVPQASAISGGATAATGRGVARSQDVVTRVVALRNLPSDAAVRVFRPLVASFGSIEALAVPNAIVVTDYAENVRRIERLAQDLDRGGGPSFESLPLKYASAKDAGAALQRIFGDGAAPGSPRIAIDERSNILLIRGDARAVAEARRAVGLLDKPGGAAPTTRVFRLSFGDAETITDVLRGLTGEGGQATNPVARSLTRTRDSIGAGSTNRFDTPTTRAFGGQGLGGTVGGGFGGIVGGGGQYGGGQYGGGQLGGSFGGLNAPVAPLSSGSSAGPAQGIQTDDLSVQPSTELNAIIVRGTPAAIAAIGQLITELDVRRPQVLIEAAIAEVTGDAAEQLGVQFGFGDAAVIGGGVTGGSSFSNLGVSLGSIVQTLLPGGVGLLGDGLSLAGGSRGDFSILVQALGTSTKANLLSTPSITTLDNEPAEIVVGQNVPFRTGSFATDTGNTLNPFTTIERQDVGITLRVVPRIHEGDSIRLEVSQEVSSLVNANLTGAADLITNRRSIQTTVLADNGDTIVLGGLITDDRMQGRSQIPVLGDIPVLGALFRSRQDMQTKRTLFVFLRPTILRDRAAVVAAAAAKYTRLRAQEAGDPTRSLLLYPPGSRLPVEILGIY